MTWYFCFKCYNLPFFDGGMGMWTNTHCFDFQIFWAGGTTGMTYLYNIYIYYLYRTIFIYIIYCIQVFTFCGLSTSAAGSLVLGFFFLMNTVT